MKFPRLIGFLLCTALLAPWASADGVFSVSTRSDSIGSVRLGSSRTDSITVTNTGSTTLTITSVRSDNSQFLPGPTAASILAGASRKFGITFTPTGTGIQTANIIFTHSGVSSPDTVDASGTGTVALFSANRKSVPFGFVAISGSKTDSVSVSNTGTASLVISSITSTNARFTASPGGATIQPGAKSTFTITFRPTTSGLQNGNIVFNNNDPTGRDTVSVSGTGTAFSINKRSVAFGNVTAQTSRRDSVTVTNTGATTLTISGVSSGNAIFTVSPTSASIAAAGTAKFYITFAPPSTGAQSGVVVFTHSALSSPDTVTVSGTGVLAGISLNRTSVAFGAAPIGGSKTDSVIVTSTGNTALVITSVTSTNGRFTVNPTSATVQPAQTRTFTVTFSPLSTTAQTGFLVFAHNAPSRTDTVTLSGTGATLLAPPALAAPANGTAGAPVQLTLSWRNVSNATGYWVQVATNSQFTALALSDTTTGIDTTRLLSGLAQNAQYYWRVSTGNSAGFGQFSASWIFTTLATGPVTGTVGFSGDVSSTSYRMFGLPGTGARKAGDILTGTQKIDWRLLRDNGKDTTYPAYYEDLTAESPLVTGEGYWLLQRKDLSISRTDTLPPLAPDGTTSIPLHSGWNMISNPFTSSVPRAAVIAANGLPAGTLFWEHIGSVRTATGGTTLDPFKSYYFDNDTAGLPALKIPYPFATALARAQLAAPAVTWRMELVYDTDINTDRDNYIGIAPEAGPGRNQFDQHEPPLVFDQGFLYFRRPEWDPLHSRFATDIRGALGSGQTWECEVWNPRGRQAKISALGVDGVPAGYGILLVDEQNTTPVDLRRTSVYTYQTTSTRMRFRVIVGTQEYVDAQTADLAPRAFELAQNYPNPFNPSTTISYMIPAGSYVRLEILSILGQRVRLLDEGYRAPATYSVVWDGRDGNRQTVASGVYFYRLIAGENVVRTRKLLLLK